MGGGLLSQVNLQMNLAAEDEGLADALRLAMEQVDALRQAMESLGELNPFAPLAEKADLFVQKMVDDTEAVRKVFQDLFGAGAAGEVAVKFNDSEALDALRQVRAEDEALRAALQEPLRIDLADAEPLDAIQRVRAEDESLREALQEPVRIDLASTQAVEQMDRLRTAGTADLNALRAAGMEASDAVEVSLRQVGTAGTAAMVDLRQIGEETWSGLTSDADRSLNSMRAAWDAFASAVRGDLERQRSLSAEAAQAGEKDTTSALDAQREAWAAYNRMVAEDFASDQRAAQEMADAIGKSSTAAADRMKQVWQEAARSIEQTFAAMGEELDTEIAAAAAIAEADITRLRAEVGGAATGGAAPYVPPKETPMLLPQLQAQGITPAEYMQGLTEAGASAQNVATVLNRLQQEAETLGVSLDDLNTATRTLSVSEDEAATAAKGAGAASGSSHGGIFGGGLMGAAINAFMVQQGLSMLQSSAMGTVDLSMLMQQTHLQAPAAEQLLGELGTVGLNPSSAFSTLGGFESSLKQALTVTGSSGLGHSALLAIAAAGGASGLQGLGTGVGAAQNVVNQLPNLGIQQQLETLSYLYQNLSSNGAGMAQIQTMFQGLGAGGTELQSLIANLAPIEHAFQGFSIPGLQTTQQVQQAGQQSLSASANMSKMDLEIMQLASATMPAFSAAVTLATDALKPVDAIGHALTAMGNVVGDIFKSLSPALPGIQVAFDSLRASVDQVAGSIEVAAGHLLSMVPSMLIGNTASLVEQRGQQNLAESLFLTGVANGGWTMGSGAPTSAAVPYQSGGNTYTINVSIPGGTSLAVRQNMETLATQVVQQLKLAQNIELSS